MNRSRLTWLRPRRGLIEWAPAVLFAAIVTFAVVALFPRGGGADDIFAPVRLLALDVAPNIIEVGGPVTFENGICNDGDVPLVIATYLGAQRQTDDPLLATTIDLVGGNTPETQRRVTLEPGCTNTEPTMSVVPVEFVPGEWKLVAVVVVFGPEGQEQRLLEQSETFTVVVSVSGTATEEATATATEAAEGAADE